MGEQTLEKRDLCYEGKAKKMYSTNLPDKLWVEFKDDATAFDGEKKATLRRKGILNQAISAHLFQVLEEKGIETHFLESLGTEEMLVKHLEVIPVEFIVRNYAAGGISRRLGISEGKEFSPPIMEFCLKDDELKDPMINHHHIKYLQLASSQEMEEMSTMAFRINQVLFPYFESKGIILVDFKLEFGRYQGKILLGDEITPDTCRFWDRDTGEKLDKDIFRQGKEGLTDAYQEVLKRLQWD